jgi:hypothetical protein
MITDRATKDNSLEESVKVWEHTEIAMERR